MRYGSRIRSHTKSRESRDMVGELFNIINMLCTHWIKDNYANPDRNVYKVDRFVIP